MKRLFIIFIGFLLSVSIVFAQQIIFEGDSVSPQFGAFGDPFISIQLSTSPSANQVLKTDGTDSSWVDVATLTGGKNWEATSWGVDLTPTSSSAGIFVEASSTFDSILRVNATTTFSVGDVVIASTTPVNVKDSALYVQSASADEHVIIAQAATGQTEHIFMTLSDIGKLLFTTSVNGETEIFHEATEDGDHTLHLETDAAGKGDVVAFFSDYDAGTLAAGEDASNILLTLDRRNTTGGDLHGILVLTTLGSADATALEVGAQVNPISHRSGTFGDMDSCTQSPGLTNILSSCTSASTDATLFTANTDQLVIGDAAKFSSIDIDLATNSNKNINVTFEFSTGNDTWTFFNPTDGTDGFQDSSRIVWELDLDTPTWAVGTSTRFYVRMTRTRMGNIATLPVENLIQISAITEFGWDLNADLEVRNATTTGHLIVGTTVPTNELSVGDVFIGGNATTTGNLTVDSTTLVVQADTNRVGIGTASPAQPLHIVADSGTEVIRLEENSGGEFYELKVESSGHLEFFNDAGELRMQLRDTSINSGSLSSQMGLSSFHAISSNGTVDFDTGIELSSNVLSLNAGGLSSAPFLEINGGIRTAVWNEGSRDYDFRIESDLDDHAFFLQGSDSLIGIGTSTPNYLFTIDGGALCIDDGTGADCNAGRTLASGDLYVGSQATSSVSLWIGSGGTVNNINLQGGDLYVQDGLEVDGDSFFQNATVTDQLVINGLASIHPTLILKAVDQFDPTISFFRSDATPTEVGSILYNESAADLNINNFFTGSNSDIIFTTGSGGEALRLKGSGVHAFTGDLTVSGKATLDNALEIPNGSAPVVDAIGEIAFDTTDNQFLISTNTLATFPAVFGMERFGGGTIASTSEEFFNGGSLPFVTHRDAFRIKEIFCHTEVAGTSVVINVSNTGGTNDTETLTCDTNGAEDLDITTNNSISAGASTTIEIGTITGSPDYVNLSVWGWRIRE